MKIRPGIVELYHADGQDRRAWWS